jgi:hypothetical protein
MPDAELHVELTRFIDEYAIQEIGRAHLAAYPRLREAGRNNFEAVSRAAAAGDDVTSLILLKLLPYADTPHNRASGAWIHIAPAITKDIRTWFERARWAKPGDWPQIANALLSFFQRVADDPNSIEAACQEFGGQPWSKGIQTAFLSLLNALQPDRFCVVNSKSRRTAKAFTSHRYPLKIQRYRATNDRIRQLIDRARPQLEPFVGDGVLAVDVFDAFCHWFIAVRDSSGEAAPAGEDDGRDVSRWFERHVPSSSRNAVEELLAFAVAEAHEQGAAGWCLTARRWGFRLNVGRIASVSLKRKQLEFGFLVEQRAGLASQLAGSDFELTDPFSAEPKAATCVVPYKFVANHAPAIRDALEAFIPVAAATAVRTPFGRSHSSDAVNYLAIRTQRALPEPDLSTVRTRRRAPAGPPPPAVAIRHPRTLFKKVDYELSNLLSYIELGDIALPDLQRPFVWTNAKVRDLFDSMYRGYPVGYLLFWSNDSLKRTRTIGVSRPQHVPSLLIVDGQQRAHVAVCGVPRRSGSG